MECTRLASKEDGDLTSRKEGLRVVTFNSNEKVVPERSSPLRNLDCSDNSSSVRGRGL